MKKIAKGALVGGGIGLGLDAKINDENEHSYLKSAFAGAALGGAAGVYGLSKISTQTSVPIQGPQGLQVPKGPVGPKGLMGPQDVQVPQKTVTGFLNTSINIPNIDINPVKTWTTNVAKSVSDSVSGGISKIKDEASIIGNQVKSTISALNSKLVDAFEATRKIAATAKQAMVRPIKLNIPNPNISFPKIPEGVYDGISNVLEGGKRAVSTYTKAGLIATATMTAGHIPMQGPAFNPVAKITHAQSSMSSSQMTKPLTSSISKSAQQAGSAFKPARPKTLETSIPQQIARQDTESLIKNPLEEIFKSFGATKKEKIIQHGLDKNKSLGDKIYKSSNLDDLYPEVKEKAELFIKKAKEQGLNLKILETFRNFNQQDKYFKQGRTTPGSIITNAKSGEGLHSYGLALDVYPVVNGKPLMTVDGPNKKYWDKMGEIAESVGFEWGGRWKFKDYPHIEISHGVSLNDMRASRVSMLDQEGKDKWFAEKIGDQQARLAKEKDPKKIEEITKSISDVKKIRGF